jgi:hypothetical protein
MRPRRWRTTQGDARRLATSGITVRYDGDRYILTGAIVADAFGTASLDIRSFRL